MEIDNIVKKIKIVIDEKDEKLRNEKYNFIRDSQYAQYLGLNRCMSYLMMGLYNNNMDLKSEGFKKHLKSVTNRGSYFNGIEFGRGIDSKSVITQKVKKDFSTAVKNGLMKGERSINNYRRDVPLITRSRHLQFYYGEDNRIYIKWVNDIKFKCIISNKKSGRILKSTLDKVISGEYPLAQSQLSFNNKNELILMLTIKIPRKEDDIAPIPGRTLGIDLGMAIPVYMTLNDNDKISKPLGSYDDFVRTRKQFQERRRRIGKQLISCKGGKGRSKKLQALNQFKGKEHNFAKTYNHYLSKKVIEFAKKHRCEYINMEKLTSGGLNTIVLANWSYYDLQTKIEYKANMNGIKVRYINPAYTSQKCSHCGYIDEENRPLQSYFSCKKCGFTANADFNASKNIAQSIDFAS